MKVWILLAVIVFTVASATSSFAGGKSTLGVYQGVRFSDGSILKSGKEADLSFFVNHGRRLNTTFESATLGAKKIKSLGNQKKSGATEKAAQWKEYASPVPGESYLVEGADGTFYLVKVISFRNQGKASAYWNLTLSWEEVTKME